MKVYKILERDDLIRMIMGRSNGKLHNGTTVIEFMTTPQRIIELLNEIPGLEEIDDYADDRNGADVDYWIKFKYDNGGFDCDYSIMGTMYDGSISHISIYGEGGCKHVSLQWNDMYTHHLVEKLHHEDIMTSSCDFYGIELWDMSNYNFKELDKLMNKAILDGSKFIKLYEDFKPLFSCEFKYPSTLFFTADGLSELLTINANRETNNLIGTIKSVYANPFEVFGDKYRCLFILKETDKILVDEEYNVYLYTGLGDWDETKLHKIKVDYDVMVTEFWNAMRMASNFFNLYRHLAGELIKRNEK